MLKYKVQVQAKIGPISKYQRKNQYKHKLNFNPPANTKKRKEYDKKLDTSTSLILTHHKIPTKKRKGKRIKHIYFNPPF